MNDEGILGALRADDIVAAAQQLPYAGSGQVSPYLVTVHTRTVGWVCINFELRVGKRDGNEVWH